MDNNKRIDKYLEDKLRGSEIHKTSGDFTKGLMFRISEENKLALEESKRDRIAKYVIGSFSSLVIIFTIIIGYLSGSQSSVKTSNSFSIEPTIETSNNYLNQFLTFISGIFNKTLELLGLSLSSQTAAIVVGSLIAVSLFLLADRVFIRSRLRSPVK
jgi:hypothetical protein